MKSPRIISANFVIGAVNMEQVPDDGLPHLAFFGRSNVGKSSLLNALMGRRGLVKVSRRPGKTREINFFLVNEAFYFADLPGIGYARVAPHIKEKMEKIIKDYVENSPHLRGIVYLIDMRRAGTSLDIETVNILRDLGRPVLIVGGKRDKLNRKEFVQANKDMRQRFNLEQDPIAVSVTRKIGLDTLWSSMVEAIAQPDI
ncbi:MAG: YihA family ribosome biogenesis GTP-binding protein [Fibrobacter sp.]|nr:YihA family ribosome biogenesis GTP-binding protein [Fibrobacter sp.]